MPHPYIWFLRRLVFVALCRSGFGFPWDVAGGGVLDGLGIDEIAVFRNDFYGHALVAVTVSPIAGLELSIQPASTLRPLLK